MDHFTLSSDLVLETLLKTNRPPTDEETAIITESAAANNAKLKGVEAQISDTMVHIQALKLQVEQAKTKLQRLRTEEAAILKTSAHHRRVLSCIRILPEDVLREIFVACVEDSVPSLSYHSTPLPFKLAQISSGMRRIVLNTPTIWTRMDITWDYFDNKKLRKRVYLTLAHRAREWLKRAGGLPITLFLWDPTVDGAADDELDALDILYDTLLSYSTLWKEFKFDSRCRYISRSLIRMAALTAIDLPLLRSVSLHIECSNLHSTLFKFGPLTLPTLKHLSIETTMLKGFETNWATITSISLCGKFDSLCYTRDELAGILRQTKCLINCNIFVAWERRDANDEQHLGNIFLLFLETLDINERAFGPPSYEARSLLDLIISPALQTLCVSAKFLQSSLLNFLKKSQGISRLTLPYFEEDILLTDTARVLRHFPSLTELNLRSYGPDLRPGKACWDANMLLREFVEAGDTGVICPRLQCIHFSGESDFSLQTLQLFLTGKQEESGTPDIAPWRKVIIDIRHVKSEQTQEEMAGLIARKQAEGLDVATSSAHKVYSQDKVSYW